MSSGAENAASAFIGTGSRLESATLKPCGPAYGGVFLGPEWNQNLCKVNMTDILIPPDNAVDQMCALMTSLARALVDQPGEVRVEPESRETETVLRLYVAPDDLGKLIGKQGRTARSLRTILGAAGMKLQHRFSLDVQTGE